MPTSTDSGVRKLIASETQSLQARRAIEQAESAPLGPWQAAQPSGTSVTLPRELSSMVTGILEILARGGTVTIGSMPEDLTTTVAADLLGVSRPTLVKLVADGELPAHKVGTHTRLRSADVMEFKRARLERQRRAFDELLAIEDAD